MNIHWKNIAFDETIGRTTIFGRPRLQTMRAQIDVVFRHVPRAGWNSRTIGDREWHPTTVKRAIAAVA